MNELSPGIELERVLSLRHFVAIGINVGIGGSIYLIGADIYRLSGTFSLVLAVAVGLFSLIVSLVMAEVSGRFERTGGCYLQTRAAFGAFCGFEVGWVLWFTRITAQASLTDGIARSVGYFFGGTLSPEARIGCILLVTIGIAALHLRQVRYGAGTMLTFAVLKILPVAIVIGAAAWLGMIRPVAIGSTPSVSDSITTALLLLFSLSGFEIIAVPAGEGRYPRRDVPLATIVSIGIVLIVFTLLHVTLINTLPDLATEGRPVAASAARLMGPWSGAAVNLGAIVSALGTCIAIHLAASRSLYAVAVDKLLPSWFSMLDPVQRVPTNAILFSTVIVLLLSVPGTFEFLAVGATLPRLIIFFGIAAALIRFRHASSPRISVPASTFALPFGSVLAALVMLACLLVFALAPRAQLTFAAAATTLGALLYAVNARSRALPTSRLRGTRKS
jgi:basic amino acid/polyamine antiporter, APA family